MLAASGHIAGVVNPPSAKKYSHWVNDKNPATPDEWLDRPRRSPARGGRSGTTGSSSTAPARSPARKPGDGKLKAIEDAPGSYVKVKSQRLTQRATQAQ